MTLADALALLAALSQGWQIIVFWFVVGALCGAGAYLSGMAWYVGFVRDDPDQNGNSDLDGDDWACGMGWIEE